MEQVNETSKTTQIETPQTDEMYSRSGAGVEARNESTTEEKTTTKTEEGTEKKTEETTGDTTGGTTQTTTQTTSTETEVTPEKKLEEAEAILKMVKEDPEGFSKQFGVDTFGPRFAKLGQQAASIRQREQDVKSAEVELTEARKIMSSMKKNPVEFVQEHLGKDGYEQWTRAILSQDDPSYPHIQKVQNQNAELREELDKIKEQLKNPQQQGPSPEQQAYFNGQAKNFWSVFTEEIKKPEYEKINRFYSPEEISNDTLELVNGTLNQGGNLLTPQEALAMLNEELSTRLKKTTSESNITKPINSPQDISGSNTLTADLQGDVVRKESTETEDFSPAGDRERMDRITAKYKI